MQHDLTLNLTSILLLVAVTSSTGEYRAKPDD